MSRRARPLLVALALFGVAGCGSHADPAKVSEPAKAADPGDAMAIPTLTDVNPDPSIVEVQLVAAPSTTEYLPGKLANVWAYRDGAVAGSAGRVPGPMLVAHRGDQVIVHFKNDLPEPTTIHWHGLRVPVQADGSTSSQAPVPPGGSFDYRFRVEDSGSFWFHPHVRADVQIEKGLYAPLIVRGDESIPVAAERYLVLDDVKLNADGQLSTETDAMDVMMGRQGNVLLVNGKRNATLGVSSGSRERWRLVNAANGRFFNLRLAGHRFNVIASDRRRERRVFDRTEELEGDEGGGTTSGAVPTDRIVQGRQDLERVRVHLVEMDPVKAHTLVLHDMLGHDLAEIAVLTGVTVSAAQSRLVRGRHDLRVRLEADRARGGSR